MTNKFNRIGGVVITLVLGSLLGFGAFMLFYGVPDATQNREVTPGSASAPSAKPLYWVAPMDPNYRRDQPGMSPMGMELIPVFSQDSPGQKGSAGTVRISPEVVNNLGVRTIEVQRNTLVSEINTVGYVTWDEDKLVHIHPRVEGWIEKLYVKAEGEPVLKGAPLYEIYSPGLVNAQEEFVLALDRNNLRLIEASEQRLRALQLSESDITALKKSRKVSQRITRYAPSGGVVNNLNIREGFFVMPSTTLMSIGALDRVWIEAEIFERQASLVKQGAPVTVRLDYMPDKNWLGRVDYVYPTLDAKTRTLKVRMRFNNPDLALKPNMFAQVNIHSASEEMTLLVPREALIRTGSQDRVVLALGGGRFKAIQVGVGRFDERNAEILSGLSEGERVVVSAQFLLDSESSKTSDFKRMNREEVSPEDMQHEGMSQAGPPGKPGTMSMAGSGEGQHHD